MRCKLHYSHKRAPMDNRRDFQIILFITLSVEIWKSVLHFTLRNVSILSWPAKIFDSLLYAHFVAALFIYFARIFISANCSTFTFIGRVVKCTWASFSIIHKIFAKNCSTNIFEVSRFFECKQSILVQGLQWNTSVTYSLI